jgi:hypothetical protein
LLNNKKINPMNTKDEFLRHISTVPSPVLCAEISFDDEISSELISENDTNLKSYYLTTGWSLEDWNNFITSIDFTYDSGYGLQYIFGNIWYADGTWSRRGEYDGSEWWEYMECPKIPDYLDRVDKVRDQKISQII